MARAASRSTTTATSLWRSRAGCVRELRDLGRPRRAPRRVQHQRRLARVATAASGGRSTGSVLPHLIGLRTHAAVPHDELGPIRGLPTAVDALVRELVD